MGTVITVDLYDDEGLDPQAVQHYVSAAAESLYSADLLFSTYNPETPMSRFRKGDLDYPDLPPEVRGVLASCKDIRKITNGWFNPWALPGGVDPTGYVKGWAAARALTEFTPSGIAGVLINAAGDIASTGGPTGSSKFRIGIADPTHPTKLAFVCEISGSIATSGTYERGEHIYDPFQHAFKAASLSASVTGPDLALCDALATALCAGGPDLLAIFADLEGYEALSLTKEGHQYTPGFPLTNWPTDRLLG
jgi:thiamine biosynthesis lipoprotein